MRDEEERRTGVQVEQAAPISVLFLLSSPTLYGDLWNDPRYRVVHAVPGHPEGVRLLPQLVDDASALQTRLAVFRAQQAPKSLVVVSDLLTGRAPGGKWMPSPLAVGIREQLATAPHLLCGLVGLTDRGVRRVSEVDVCVPSDCDSDTLFKATLAASTAVRLKSPPVRRIGDSKNIRVRFAESLDEVRQCLALRRLVYGLLHYLPLHQIDDPSGLEIDAWDARAIHLVAVDGNAVLGTARLIVELPYDLRPVRGLSVPVLDVHRRHGIWARTLVRYAASAVRESASRCQFWYLPILQSTDFSDRWSPTLAAISPAAEVSRVVVDPSFRGRGISRLLVEMALKAARGLRRRAVVLECIPAHQQMYEKYGFRRIRGVHSRDADLDQLAVAMCCGLDSMPEAMSGMFESGQHDFDSPMTLHFSRQLPRRHDPR